LAKPIDPQSPEIQALRERIFQGKVNSPTLCAIFDRDPRTLSRWKARGLPYVTIGNEDWYDLDRVRSWIDAPESRAGAARPRGRPKSPHTAERIAKSRTTLPPRAVSMAMDGSVEASDAEVVVERVVSRLLPNSSVERDEFGAAREGAGDPVDR
jgi:predicted dehydrogenase